MEDPSAREEPRAVNQYLLGDVIGEGQFGKVREAMNSKTAKRVAIKKLSMERVKKARAIGMVKQEVAVIKLLQKHVHKHVVKFFEVIEQRDNHNKERVYFIMELVKGGTLQRVMESAVGHKVPVDPLRSYFKHLMRGLAHIHEKGIVHRDVKPENLMITVEGVAKICDFGTAEQLDTFVNCGEPILLRTRGTPEFYAPEIASGEGSIGGTAVDVWAAGVTLFLALLASVPFKGQHQQLYDAITQTSLELPDELDPAVADLLQCMLCKHEVPVEGSTSRRATVQEVLSHRWCNASAAQGFADPMSERLFPIDLPQVYNNSVLRKISGLAAYSATTSFVSEDGQQSHSGQPSATTSFADATSLFLPAPLSQDSSVDKAASVNDSSKLAAPKRAAPLVASPRSFTDATSLFSKPSGAACVKPAPRSFAAALSLFTAASTEPVAEKPVMNEKPLKHTSSAQHEGCVAAPGNKPVTTQSAVIADSPLPKQPAVLPVVKRSPSKSPVPKEKEKCAACVVQ